MARTQEPKTYDKPDSLKLTTDQIEKKFGKGSIMKLGEGSSDLEVGVIPTGALALDAALGIGGVPRGRIIEIYGPESSGKTTLALQIIAEAQAAGGIVAFIDAEHALDPTYAARLGVDIDEVLISQPDYGEQALEICDMLVRSNAISAIVIASASQARRLALEIQDDVHLHQSAAREDRRVVRQSRDDDGRSRAEVLRQRAHRHTSHRDA